MMEYPRLNSDVGKLTKPFDGEPTIIPLEWKPEEKPQAPPSQTPQETKEVTIKEYVDGQCNSVVGFLINWVKTEFLRDLLRYLHTDFKENIKKEILNELKAK